MGPCRAPGGPKLILDQKGIDFVSILGAILCEKQGAPTDVQNQCSENMKKHEISIKIHFKHQLTFAVDCWNKYTFCEKLRLRKPLYSCSRIRVAGGASKLEDNRKKRKRCIKYILKVAQQHILKRYQKGMKNECQNPLKINQKSTPTRCVSWDPP